MRSVVISLSHNSTRTPVGLHAVAVDVPRAMSLKELKGLAPWQWDAQTKKHAIGPKGLQDFEEVRVCFSN